MMFGCAVPPITVALVCNNNFQLTLVKCEKNNNNRESGRKVERKWKGKKQKKKKQTTIKN